MSDFLILDHAGQTLDSLQDRLGDTSTASGEAMSAIAAMRYVGDRQATLQVLARLVSDKGVDPTLRSMAAREVAAFGQEGMEILAPLLSDGPPWLRRAALQSLGRLGEREALDGLSRVRAEDPATVRDLNWARALLGFRFGQDIGDWPAGRVQTSDADGVEVSVEPVLRPNEELAAIANDFTPGQNLSGPAIVLGLSEPLTLLFSQNALESGVADKPMVLGITITRHKEPTPFQTASGWLLNHPDGGAFQVSSSGVLHAIGRAETRDGSLVLSLQPVPRPGRTGLQLEARISADGIEARVRASLAPVPVRLTVE